MKNINYLFTLSLLVLTFCYSPNLKSQSDIYKSDCSISDKENIPLLKESDVDPIVLENEFLKATFDRNSGRFVELTNKETGWTINRRAILARSFKLLVPFPERRNNTVFGEKQKLNEVKTNKDNSRIVFVWQKLLCECQDTLDIIFEGIVELTDKGLQFNAIVDNNSPYTVEAVYWPYIGDLSTPAESKKLSWLRWEWGQLKEFKIFPDFQSAHGYFGVDYPIQTHVPSSRVGLLHSEDQGLYMGCHDTTESIMVSYNFELKPGYEFPWGMGLGPVPEKDTLDGQYVRVEFSCAHLIYANPGESINTPPIVIEPYKGTWHKGVNHYKEWRKTWMEYPPLPEWAQEVHSWYQIQINSSEDHIRFKYKDLVDYAKDCAEHNVKVIHVIGWTKGGQDRGNPSHDIDPRLGTLAELKEAISKCHKMGVKVILFGKYTWADQSQDWFKDELIKYSIKDPYGNYYWHPGYKYHTITQLLDINTRRLIAMCPLSAKWREIACKEFSKVIETGAAGMVYDENQHHGIAKYCFDPSHGHHVPANVFSGDYELAKDFRKIVKEKNPEFIMAGESLRDSQFRNYSFSYIRIANNHIPMHRYAAPFANILVTVFGHNDRITINQALMYRYIIIYEPRYFKGRLNEIPLTIDYGKKVDALRKKYSDYLWSAEFRHALGANVLTDGKNYNNYSVFVNNNTGKRAVVVSNFDKTQSINIEVKLNPPAKKIEIVTPDDLSSQKSNGVEILKPLSVVVLLEK